MRNNFIIGTIAFVAISVCIAIGFYMGWESVGKDTQTLPDAIVPPVVDTLLQPPEYIPPHEIVPPVIEDLPAPQEPDLPEVKIFLFQPDIIHHLDTASLPRDSLRPQSGSNIKWVAVG